MYKKNRFTKLRCFCAVVENGSSITKASESLNKTQPDVSEQIKSLEEDLGYKLFDRKSNKITLNELGRSFYEQFAKPAVSAVLGAYSDPELISMAVNTGDIKTSKYSIWIHGLIKKALEIIESEVYVKNLKITLKTKVVIRLKHILFISLVILTYIISTLCIHFLNINFKAKNKSIIHDITQSIDKQNEMMSVIVKNSVLFVQEYMQNHPNMKRSDLLVIKEKLGNPTISIFDKKGYFYMTTSDVMNPSHEHYEYYKSMSLLSGVSAINATNKLLSVFPTCHQACYVQPGHVLIMPLYRRLTPRVYATRNGYLCDTQQGYIFDVSYSDNDVERIIKDIFNVHDYISYIAIKDPKGNLIISHGKEVPNIFAVDRYSESFIVEDFAKYQVLKTCFGKEIDVTGMTIDGSTSYFYVLEVGFSKKDLDNSIFLARALMVFFWAVLVIIYAVSRFKV